MVGFSTRRDPVAPARQTPPRRLCGRSAAETAAPSAVQALHLRSEWNGRCRNERRPSGSSRTCTPIRTQIMRSTPSRYTASLIEASQLRLRLEEGINGPTPRAASIARTPANVCGYGRFVAAAASQPVAAVAVGIVRRCVCWLSGMVTMPAAPAAVAHPLPGFTMGPAQTGVQLCERDQNHHEQRRQCGFEEHCRHGARCRRGERVAKGSPLSAAIESSNRCNPSLRASSRERVVRSRPGGPNVRRFGRSRPVVARRCAWARRSVSLAAVWD
jgi:hypothetical protein